MAEQEIKTGESVLLNAIKSSKKAEEVPVTPEAPVEDNGSGILEEQPTEDPIIVNDDGTEAGTAPEVEKPADVVEEQPTVDDSDIPAVIEEWDVVGSSEEPQTQAGVDLKEVGNAFGVTKEVKSLDELVNIVKEQAKASQVDALADVPDNLKQAIEFAKEGGDYLSLLDVSSIDYNKVDPRVMVENQVLEMGLFRNSEGGVDEDALADYMDSLPEADVNVRGTILKKQLIAEQEAKKQSLITAQREKKANADRELKYTLEKIDAVAGFKLNPKHRADIFNDVSSGKMIQNLFYDKNGNYDYNKMVTNYFKAKYFDNIQSFYTTKVSNQTKKEMIDSVTNPDLGTSGALPKAEVAKPISGIAAEVARLKGLHN